MINTFPVARVVQLRPVTNPFVAKEHHVLRVERHASTCVFLRDDSRITYVNSRVCGRSTLECLVYAKRTRFDGFSRSVKSVISNTDVEVRFDLHLRKEYEIVINNPGWNKRICLTHRPCLHAVSADTSNKVRYVSTQT